MKKNIKPIEIAYQEVRNLPLNSGQDVRFLSSDFAYVRHFQQLKQFVSFTKGDLYRLKEGRIMYMLKGNATFNINLITYHLEAHSLTFLSSDSLIEICDIDENTDMRFLLICDAFIRPVCSDELLNPHLGKKICVHLPPSEQLERLVQPFFTLLEAIISEEPLRREALQHPIVSFLYNIRYMEQERQQRTEHKLSNQEVVFRKFIALVNRYSLSERNVAFYADKLCLTPRYLNTLIREASRQTVMYWINKAIILEAKMNLKQNRDSIAEVSDRLKFANPSFFCKFFKKHTGMTPLQYKKSS